MSSQDRCAVSTPVYYASGWWEGCWEDNFYETFTKRRNWFNTSNSIKSNLVLFQASTRFAELTEILPAIEYVQDIPSEIDSMFDRSVINLIILDDMMDKATQDKRIS